jgi:small subunit ribosomal protein S4
MNKNVSKNTKVPDKNKNLGEKKVKHFKKLSEYGKQLSEKQKVKKIYGIREKQFFRFFLIAKKSKESTGSTFLSLLERRLDNVIFRLKFALTRTQARQMIVHGHFKVNNKKASSPSMIINENDVISLSKSSIEKTELIKSVVEKQFSTGTKVPGWLELTTENFSGRILRLPVREDIQATINENFIVELYSK